MPLRAPARSGLGMGLNQLVFSCFNPTDKFDPHRFGAWMGIQIAVPGNVLLLVVSNRLARAGFGSAPRPAEWSMGG